MHVQSSLPLFALLGASLMWGVAWWPLQQIAALGIDGIPLALGAFGALSMLLLPLLFLRRRHWNGEGVYLLAIALLGGYANLAFTGAMIYGEVVRVMVLFYLLPLWGVLGGRLFFDERVDAARAAAVVLALVGAVQILGGARVFNVPIAGSDLLAVSCGLAYTGNNLLFRARQSLPVIDKVAAMLSGCFALAAVLMAFGVQGWPQSALHNWLWVVAYGLGWVLPATVAAQWAITHLEAGPASILIILELVTAVMTAVWIGGERMSGAEGWGAALILAAALIEARRRGKDGADLSDLRISQATLPHREADGHGHD